MEIVAAGRFPNRDRAGLCDFLTYVRAQARARGQAQLASISLNVPHIAPLAVLESIYDPNALHAYFEHPQSDLAIAAAEAIESCEVTGPERFAQAQAWARATLERTICIGDLDTPLSGLHIFCRFNFDPRNEQTLPGYPPGTLFIPRWQVARNGADYTAVANARIAPDTAIEPLLERIWAAYSKFSAYDYTHPHRNRLTQQPYEPLAEQPYEQWVQTALEHIHHSDLRKVVLARALDRELDETLSPFDCLHRLRERYASCHTYSWGNAHGGAFIGASPERLVRLDNGLLKTEALAGSAPRGKDTATDATLANQLLRSEKDLREHRMVCDGIVKTLAQLGLKARHHTHPHLRQLANLQHLCTPIEAAAADTTLLEAAAALHPTAATCGHPTTQALTCIETLEAFRRGPYAGCLGWFDAHGQGELIVALRCALLQRHRARLFAGAGIVEGSTPEAELAETNLKLSALNEALHP